MSGERDMPERVVCAAIRHADGSIICGPRHYDAVMIKQIQASGKDWRTAEQGFVNQWGGWLTREGAYVIARCEKQIVRELSHSGVTLYSEHLY